LGTRVKKEAVIAFGRVADTWNSAKKFMISSFIISQHTLKRLKLKPSGPGHLFPSLLQMASLTSSTEKGAVNKQLSSTYKD
jgi:hypothetical protein